MNLPFVISFASSLTSCLLYPNHIGHFFLSGSKLSFVSSLWIACCSLCLKCPFFIWIIFTCFSFSLNLTSYWRSFLICLPIKFVLIHSYDLLFFLFVAQHNLLQSTYLCLYLLNLSLPITLKSLWGQKLCQICWHLFKQNMVIFLAQSRDWIKYCLNAI